MRAPPTLILTIGFSAFLFGACGTEELETGIPAELNPPEDIRELVARHATIPELAISGMAPKNERELEVMTGSFADGRGEVFIFRRGGEKWEFVRRTVWVE